MPGWPRITVTGRFRILDSSSDWIARRNCADSRTPESSGAMGRPGGSRRPPRGASRCQLSVARGRRDRRPLAATPELQNSRLPRQPACPGAGARRETRFWRKPQRHLLPAGEERNLRPSGPGSQGRRAERSVANRRSAGPMGQKTARSHPRTPELRLPAPSTPSGQSAPGAKEEIGGRRRPPVAEDLRRKRWPGTPSGAGPTPSGPTGVGTRFRGKPSDHSLD